MIPIQIVPSFRTEVLMMMMMMMMMIDPVGWMGDQRIGLGSWIVLGVLLFGPGSWIVPGD
jgi:uncharacterized membrane protein YdcZ (DUF606 family)